MRRPIVLLSVLAAGLATTIGGCSSGDSDRGSDRPPVQNQPPQAQKPDKPDDAPRSRARQRPGTHAGVLKGNQAAIGGETTGWILDRDGDRPDLDVDVSRIRDQAARLDGKQVVITGRLVERKYPERGRVRVLMAESIVAADMTRY